MMGVGVLVFQRAFDGGICNFDGFKGGIANPAYKG